MKQQLLRLTVFYVLSISTTMVHAVDSYRYAHVTIDTPWAIFIFLLVIILVPFILMAILHWHFAIKKSGPDNGDGE